MASNIHNYDWDFTSVGKFMRAVKIKGSNYLISCM